jgi:Zn-finger protein
MYQAAMSLRYESSFCALSVFDEGAAEMNEAPHPGHFVGQNVRTLFCGTHSGFWFRGTCTDTVVLAVWDSITCIAIHRKNSGVAKMSRASNREQGPF